MNSLTKTYNACKSDKGWHGFGEFYEPYFTELKKERKDLRYLELGLWKGGSVAAFSLFAPNAVVYGLDCDQEAVDESRDRVKDGYFELCNLDIEEEVYEILSRWGTKFDIILDDAGHDWRQQFNNMLKFSNYLTEGGIYILEDLHTSFYPEYANTVESFNVMASPLALLTLPVDTSLFSQEVLDLRQRMRSVKVYYYDSLDHVTSIIQF